MSTTKFGDAVKNFVSAGISPRWLLPIAPKDADIAKGSVLKEAVLGKAPGRYLERADGWTGLAGGRIVNGISRDDWAEMRDWPTPNAGVLGRAYPGIDSDAATPEAKTLVEGALKETFGKDAVFGERIRGDNPRRLYTFKCANPTDKEFFVKTRHVTYELDGTESKLDIIGYGGQYLITGIHPSGDRYEWHPDRSLVDLAPELTEIDNNDIERFLETFEELLDGRGGKITRSSGGGGSGDEYDTRELKPSMSFDTVKEALAQLPNTPDTFLHRDDFVSALAAIRAALGKDALNRDVEDEIREWATKDPEWCDDEYFDKIWNSLDRVRVSPDSLDRLLRRNGIRSHVRDIFDGATYSDEIRKVKKEATTERDELLDTVASRYLFGHVNNREGVSIYTMRDVWNVEREWGALAWWKMELAESDRALIAKLQENDDYPANKVGLANFLRDMHRRHPESFYAGETRHPNYDKGEIFQEPQADGSHKNLVNMRFISPAIRHARKKDPNPEQSKRDVEHILEFARRLFGPMSKFELDTLAFMAQTGDRPGSLLFLVGDSGVGKSIWQQLQMLMFDGAGPDGSAVLDGAKLLNENARRFAFHRAEGRRIITIKELPEGGSPRELAAITSTLKQVVDPGPEGDWILIEAKGENQRLVRNFARVIISSNYANSIHIEAQDRRIFYVNSAITLENKPDPEFYAELVAIIHDPTRLAAFFRYLRKRDITGYTRHTEPPMSTEKLERVVSEIHDPAQRHLRAAMELMVASERLLFDTEELADLMTKMSEYEFKNSGGVIDDRADYNSDKGGLGFARVIKNISKRHAVKLEKQIRTSTKRQPAIWLVCPWGRDRAPEFIEMDKETLLDRVEQEYERGYTEHPLPLYRKS